MHSVYWESTWSLESAVCPSSSERQVPKGLFDQRHILPSQRVVSELREDVSCLGTREGWLSDWISGYCLWGYTDS